MNPAFSVLVFTVSSGAGYGLMVLLAMTHLTGLFREQPDYFIVYAGAVALILITIGLLSSTLHLANPRNAWRAFSRFRTSWLSREGVFAVAFYPFSLGYLVSCFLQPGDISAFTLVTGIGSIILSLATLFSTGMIYASLKTIRQWNTSLTPVSYLILGLMSGGLVFLALQQLVYQSIGLPLIYITLGLVILGVMVKMTYFFWIGKPAGSSINTATGFTQASVRLLDVGHSSDTFLTKEFSYEVAADKLLRLRALMLLLAFVIPLVCLFMQAAYLLAAVVSLTGLLVERWLFFAEARHVVRLYHGDQTT